MSNTIVHQAPMKCNPLLTQIDSERGLCRRSRRMPLADAFQLWQRLKNLQHIEAPQIVKVKQGVQGQTAVVIWEPAKEESKDALRMAFRASRLARAAEQLPVMSFYPIENRPGLYAAVNDDGHGGGSHVIDQVHEECDCEDFRFRCLPLGEKCHHLHALDLHIERATLPAPKISTSDERAAERAERNARIQATIGSDF